MKITHTESGKPYHLKPGTQLEIERTNLFFNEWGEQTIPIELPDTGQNRELMGFPDKLTNRKKPPTRIPVTIEDGEYFMPCRQAILSGQRKTGISSSFYMNEGSFLSRISQTSLREIFGNETVAGVNTVSEGINFCRSLINTRNDTYAIFPVIIEMDGERKYLNRVEYMNEKGEYSGNRSTVGQYNYLGLVNEFERTEEVDGYKILLAPGYYISPFLRAGYVLRRIFTHFGYTLLPNFFDVTEPFSDMVFINNTMDALVNGTILLSHLVPDCRCNTILDVYRKKFCCEFIPDETQRTVKIEMFRDVLQEPAHTNLSPCLTSPYKIQFVEPKQIKLSSKSQVSDGPVYDSIAEVMVKHPEGYYDKRDGAFYHNGYTHNYRIIEKIACSTIPYFAGGDIEAKEITVPDCAVPTILEPERQNTVRNTGGERPSNTTSSRSRPNMFLPFIGEANALNSTVKLNKTEKTDEEEENTDIDTESSSKNKEQAPILSFVYFSSRDFYLGTTTNYSFDGTKIFDYSLHYNGPDGIFERFYRPMDDLYRNSLHTVSAELLLSQHQKMSIPAHKKVLLDGAELLIDKLKYSIGGTNEPVESELLTTSLYEPVDRAPEDVQRFLLPEYEWGVKQTVQTITKAEYDAAVSKADSLPAIYPILPTKAMYDAGGEYHQRIYYYTWTSRFDGEVYEKITSYLTPVLFGTKTGSNRG